MDQRLKALDSLCNCESEEITAIKVKVSKTLVVIVISKTIMVKPLAQKLSHLANKTCLYSKLKVSVIVKTEIN